MNIEVVTFANDFGELLEPFLIALRWTGFFEAYVYIPIMTVLSIVIFINMKHKIYANNTFEHPIRKRFIKTFLFAYYSLCFLLTNSTAVAFKTLIVEEMDYDKLFWYIPYVSSLHFYITSVVIAYLYLLHTNKSTISSRILCFYIQIALIGGYYIGIHRILNEPFNLLDVTSGVSGVFFFIWFGIFNIDITQRFFRPLKNKQHNGEILFSDANL